MQQIQRPSDYASKIHIGLCETMQLACMAVHAKETDDLVLIYFEVASFKETDA